MISIDEDARKRFESDWLSGRSLSIKEYLPKSSTDTYIGTLEELVCIDLEFRWRQNRSDGPSHDHTMSLDEAAIPTRVEDYVREFPELNQTEILARLVEQEIYVRVHAGFVVEPSEYHSRFPSLILDESLFQSHDDEATKIGGAPTPESDTAAFPQPFGSYILTEQLGRGGMGAVYRARQPAAGREVAIKVADVSSMNSATRNLVRQRFETEAHAAASLSHDHVVPIYDVGVVNEQPFYAMRLVEGGDLGAMSKAEPLEPRRAARYMLGIARGIASAHTHGMLHRDIKPQNVLVEQATDRAMITDFGLARFTYEDSGLTQTGQVLGTPSFMAPEQIKNSTKIDARADIYSLGGTLYQLLTGRPPFKSSDVQDTLRQVLSEDPVPPRRLNSGIDRDLDTICLKCLEKDPEDRYSTAEALAQELTLFLEGKPIVARPAGPTKRLTKWCRRNRTLAAALSVAVLATVATIISTTAGWLVTAQKNELLVTTNDVVMDSFDELYVQISDEPLLAMPGVEPVRRQLLERSLGYYRRLIELNDGNPAMQADRAFALAAIGHMGVELDLPAIDTEPYLEEAIREVARLPEQAQKSVQLFAAKSNALVGLGVIARKRQELDAAVDYFQRAQEVRRSWVAAYPEDIEAGRKLANALMNEGLVRKAQKKFPESEALLLESQKLRQKLLAEVPQDTKLRRDMAKCEFNLAFLELAYGNLPEVLPRLHHASNLFRELASEVGIDGRLWQSKVTSLVYEADLSTSLRTEDAMREAAVLLEEAVNDLRALLNIYHGQIEHSVALVKLYQQAVETLLSMNSAQVENLAMAEDAITHLNLVLQTLNQAASADGMQPAVVDEIQKLNLHAGKHDALLSVCLDQPDIARRSLAKAIHQFEERASLVAADARLAADLEQLQLLLAELPPQTETGN